MPSIGPVYGGNETATADPASTFCNHATAGPVDPDCNVGDASRYAGSAAHVRGPTMPSTVRPCAAWKLFTAVSRLESKIPVIGPKGFQSRCRARTRCRRLTSSPVEPGRYCSSLRAARRTMRSSSQPLCPCEETACSKAAASTSVSLPEILSEQPLLLENSRQSKYFRVPVIEDKENPLRFGSGAPVGQYAGRANPNVRGSRIR